MRTVSIVTLEDLGIKYEDFETAYPYTFLSNNNEMVQDYYKKGVIYEEILSMISYIEGNEENETRAFLRCKRWEKVLKMIEDLPEDMLVEV